jgi:hypothetical protein
MSGQGDYQVRPDRRLRVATKFGGRGDFLGDLWDGAKNVASKIVKGAGWISDNAGWLGPLIGGGDYKVGKQPRHNSLFRGSMVPSISNTSIPTIIHHREYLGEITSYSGLGGSDFQIKSFNVNPALPASAPWLNGIAGKYGQYILMGGAYEFVSEQTAISTDSVGTVVISPRYDVTLPAPTTTAEILNTEGKVDGRPVDNLLMGIECDPSVRPVEVLQCRTGALPANAALQMFDHSIVDITNWGQADSTKTIGHVYAIYEIALINPVDLDANDGEVLTDHGQLTSVTSANNLGTTAALAATSTLVGTITAGSTQKYTFPSFVNSGEFLVCLFYTGSAATNTAFTFTGTNCSKQTYWSTTSGFDLGSVAQVPQAGVSVQNQSVMYIVNVTNAPASFTITGGTFAGTTYGDLLITPWSSNVVTLNSSRRRWRQHWKALDEEERVRSEQMENISERTAKRVLEELLGLARRSKSSGVESGDEKSFEHLSPREEADVVALLTERFRSSSLSKLPQSPRNLPVVQPDAPRGATGHGRK